ncbi:hypothetical protein B0F90DRAFT_1376531 [Multifurca ochricompacta]|uniref:Uncharacterized protein n=1 Tax=Multifurca ochricompacta TaxID=376703 RepID=A0AAD4QND9_9AGAM|nr:hypothetical protein B0F90DRAFT_1376531 [Multifurca ochricompacta]
MRPPTPPPPCLKRKSVTFASLQEGVKEQPTVQEIPSLVITPTRAPDKREHIEVAPEVTQVNKLSPGVDDSLRSGLQLTVKPHFILPSSGLASRMRVTAESSSLLPSPPTLRRNHPYLTEATLSPTVSPKQRRHARNASSPSSGRAGPVACGSYLIPIMEVLDEIHVIIKSNIRMRFESASRDTIELRRQILAQAQADMTALLDEYIAAFNDLVNLEAKYGTFSKRRIAAFTQARNANAEGLSSLLSQIQIHDRAVQAHARQTFAVGPLPGPVRRWL